MLLSIAFFVPSYSDDAVSPVNIAADIAVWLTFAPPVLMAWVFLKVSGIPLLEARMADRRNGYHDYMRTTSALILWPPKELHR